MMDTSKIAVPMLGVAMLAFIFAGCGSNVRPRHPEAEVRAMFTNVAAYGREHDFGQICQHEMDAQLRQLISVAAGSCVNTLAAEWAEGVQLSKISSQTRVLISGNKATVFDGTAPDRAVYTHGRWKLAEVPRNRRFDKSGEAQEEARTINEVLRERHQPELPEEIH